MAANDDGKISQNEIWSLFGDQIPMEVIALLWDSPPDKTIGQMREELRALVAHLSAKPSRPIEEIKAADAFVHSLVNRCDFMIGDAPLWYGWAIADGFHAGIAYARQKDKLE
jgi:hypothetical protein